MSSLTLLLSSKYGLSPSVLEICRLLELRRRPRSNEMAIPSSTCPRNPPRDANRAEDDEEGDDGVAKIPRWIDVTDDDAGGGGGGGRVVVVENDDIEDEMAEKNEETTPLSFSVATSLAAALREEAALFAFEPASDLLLAPPLVPASNDENDRFMDALLNRGGRGIILWLDRKPDTVSTKYVGKGIKD